MTPPRSSPKRAWEFEEKRDEVLKNAGLDGVITMQTVATILGAENMSMPAGYVYDASENQYMVRVGDKFASLDELKNVKLFSLGLEGVDDVRLCDVARVEITDNSAETFTKVDGEDGILLSIEKQSTFSTTDVAKRVAEKNAELMNSESGLSIIDLFNQGDYIDIIVDSVLSNLVSGGALAILILLIFLMDYRPTIIIAFSIPLSVVAAFVCMYFTGITLNVLSLSGLALGVGMLVDNSIVAIENIYRLRNEEHLPILTACIQGVSQISGALLASTLTTIWRVPAGRVRYRHGARSVLRYRSYDHVFAAGEPGRGDDAGAVHGGGAAEKAEEGAQTADLRGDSARLCPFAQGCAAV